MESEPVPNDATMNKLNELCDEMAPGSSSTLTTTMDKLGLLFNNAYTNPIADEDPNNWGDNVKEAIKQFRIRHNVEVSEEKKETPVIDAHNATILELNKLCPYPRTNFHLEEI